MRPKVFNALLDLVGLGVVSGEQAPSPPMARGRGLPRHRDDSHGCDHGRARCGPLRPGDRAVRLSSFRVSLRNVTSSQICIPDTDLAAGFSATCDSGVTLTFEDLASSASAELHGGGTFRLSGIAPRNYYTINIVWKQSGSIISSVTLPTS